MTIRRNVVFKRWQEDYIKKVSVKGKMSFSETVRKMISCCAIHGESCSDLSSDDAEFRGRAVWEKRYNRRVKSRD